MIGTVGIYGVKDDAAQLGYGLHPDYWGKGYGGEAVKLFINCYWAAVSEFSISVLYLIELMSVKAESKDAITADVDPTNPASTGLVTKLGFKKGEHQKGVYQLASEVRDGIKTKRDAIVWRLGDH